MAQEAQVKFTADIAEIMGRLNALENKFRDIPKEAEKAEKKTSQSLNDIGKSAGNTFASIAAGIGAAFSVNAVLNFAKTSIDAFAKAEAQTNQLRFAVERVGQMGSKVFDQLIKQSEKLAKISFFDDEDIQDAQRLLVQIGLNADEIERLTPLVLDLAATMGTDLSSAAGLAVSAINGQTRGLKEAGANFENTGTKVGNYNMLVEKLSNLQGAATDALNTTSGAMKKQAVDAENLQESIGKRLAPVFIELKTSALNALDGLLKLFGLGDKTKSDQEKLKDSFKAIADENLKAAESLTDDQLKEKIEVNKKTIESLKDEYYKLVAAKSDAFSLNRSQAAFRALEIENEGLEKLIGTQKKVENANSLAKQDAAAKAKKDSEQALKDKEKENEAFQKLFEDSVNENERIVNIDYKNFLQGLKDKEKAEKDFQDFFDQALSDNEQLVNQDYTDRLKALREFEAQRRLIVQESFALAAELLTGIQELQANSFDSEQEQLDQRAESINAYYDAEAAALEKKNERGSISDRIYAAQREALDIRRKKADEELAKSQRRLQREQAISNKVFALFNIGLSTAQAIISALALTPPNIPLSIFAGATGAIQLAVAAAAPIPGFKDGTKFLDDPKAKRGIDTILMYGNRGERIITAEDNQKHWEKYEAIEAGNWHKYVEKEAHAQLLMNARKEHTLREKESFAGSITNALTSVAANNPTIDFKRVLDKGIYIKNWDDLKEILSDLQPAKINHW